MIERPALAAIYDAVALSRDSVLLRTPALARIVHQPFWGAVLPLTDGTRTADEIADQLEITVSLAHTYYALMCMERERILVESPGEVHLEQFSALAVMTDDYLDPALAALAQSATLDHPFIPVRISGDAICAGPVVTAIETWGALVRRLKQNLHDSATRVLFPASEDARRIAPVEDASPPFACTRHNSVSFAPPMLRMKRTFLPSEDHATPATPTRSADSKSVRGPLPSAAITTTVPLAGAPLAARMVVAASIRLSGLKETAC